jgi:hypothetical protein
MTDKELLELAAKAAGMPKGAVMGGGDYLYESKGKAIYWNPLTDDGDAFRLAVKLHIDVNYRGLMVFAEQVGPVEVDAAESEKLYPLRPYSLMAVCGISPRADPYAATRRTIVRAAAEIGRDKE